MNSPGQWMPEGRAESPNSPANSADSGATDRVIDDVLARIQRLATADGKSAPSTASLPEPAKPRARQESQKIWYLETGDKHEPFVPQEPKSLEDAGVTETVVEEIIVRYLFTRSEATGKQISWQVKLPFRLIEPILNRLKSQQLTFYAGTTATHDYVHVLSDAGRDRARRYLQKTTYFGSAPVHIDDYIKSVKLQSVEKQHPNRDELRAAFSDLLIPSQLLSRLGPAVNSGRGMFLYGYPGNGKTSIAERVTKAFGEFIWIPRAISIDGDIMRIFDPMKHERSESDAKEGLIDERQIDRRWVRIRRPTIVAGGELTMDMLEVQRNSESNICDAPLQMKSNCGVLLIDDFGRQRMSVDELLNRWIVPLEKRHDYITVAGGKTIQVPFDQLVIFSTNLEPKDLVDDAFLRRIPYKIEVPNPSEEAFRKLFEIMCKVLKIPHNPEMVEYLIVKHYKPIGRPFRNCHPRDLLLQVRSYCLFNSRPLEMNQETMDFAVENYFSIM